MPLPPALLARLKRRGIVGGEEEEVIAESYDEEGRERREEPRGAAGAPGCPNKWISFHQCVEFCWDRWGEGTPEDRVDPDYERKRLRMKRRYPLPLGWKEIYDAGISRHYYWNPEKDEVSWLSPAHPAAVISDPAPRLAKVVFDKVAKRYASDARRKEETKRDEERGRKRRRRSPVSGRSRRAGGEAEEEADPLDPMDPASYSDVPRGGWASGLEVGGVDAVTGADVTASGPLFQQRPYPSPGAILRKSGKKPKPPDN